MKMNKIHKKEQKVTTENKQNVINNNPDMKKEINRE